MRRIIVIAIVIVAAISLVAMGIVSATAAEPDAAGGARASRGNAVDDIYPVPQSATTGGARVNLRGKVTLVVGVDTDPAAVKAAKAVLRAQSRHRITVVKPTKASRVRGGSVVYLGTTADNKAVGSALGSLEVDGNSTLKHDEGYVLATGRIHHRPTAVLAGADKTGSFYAVQTLRQTIKRGSISPVIVKDWPKMSVRGAIEGFYGTPWSHQARLDQFAFYGRQKMNTYIYSPKDDPLLRAKWRDKYTGKQKTQLKELVDSATANHVDFTYALSPGNDICYSDKSDLSATVSKFESLYELGVRNFYIALDDIEPELKCDADKKMFNTNEDGFKNLADAQAYYLNAVDAAFVKKHDDVGPLQMVPTNYNGSAADPYKGELGKTMNADIQLQWTGESVVSHRITTKDTLAAGITYGTKAVPRQLFLWDNYPVNDFAKDRLFLAPLIGRDKDLYTATAGITANPMIQSYASMPTLFNYADFTWNGPAYKPKESMAAALNYVAGQSPRARKSLRAFADLNQNWQDDEKTPNAPELSADVARFWKSYESTKFPAHSALAKRARLISAMPRDLQHLAVPGFYDDTKNWIGAASHWGDATTAAIRMLQAVGRGDGRAVVAHRKTMTDAVKAAGEATQPTLDEGKVVPKVGDGVFGKFIKKAKSEADTWLGVEPAPGASPVARTSMNAYGSNSPDKMFDSDPSTLFWTDAAPKVGDYIGTDLGAEKSISSITVQQSESDSKKTDMMYHAKLQYSTDGENWQDAGTFDDQPVITKTFDSPVKARYVRIIAAAPNPGAQWIKVREFGVSTVPDGVTSTITAAEGTALADVVDGRIDSAWTASRTATRGDCMVFDTRRAKSVTVIGSASGTVQVRRHGTWKTIGRLASGYTKVPVRGGKSVTGVRLLFARGTTPTIHEVILK